MKELSSDDEQRGTKEVVSLGTLKRPNAGLKNTCALLCLVAIRRSNNWEDPLARAAVGLKCGVVSVQWRKGNVYYRSLHY